VLERVIRSDYAGRAHPKMKRVKKRPSKKALTPEDRLQGAADELLTLYHWVHLHLPDGMFRAIKSHPRLSEGVKINLLTELRSWPDNMPFLPIGKYKGVSFCLSPLIENKSDIGKLHGQQKIRNRELGYNVCRTVEDIQNIIKVSGEFLDFIQKAFANYGPSISTQKPKETP